MFTVFSCRFRQVRQRWKLVLLFKRFQQTWPYIDQKQYETGAKLDEIRDSVKLVILEFAQNQLLQESVRDDYREFIELLIVFLGGIPA